MHNLSADSAERVDAICDFFEQQFTLQQRPRIEDFLDGCEARERHVLLHELLWLEVEFLKRSGLTPDPLSYLSRFPNDTGVVQHVFAGVSASVPKPSVAGGGHGGWRWPQIPNYVIYKELGAGYFGTVYRAIQTHLRSEVALKLLKPERIETDTLELFQEEMLHAGALQHPNVVRALYAGIANGLPYLVMDLVHGMNLAEVLRRCGPLRAADACEVVRQAAAGLQHAHECSMVHRDIKPSNLMLGWLSARDRDQAEVKVADFGLARLRGRIAWRGKPLQYERVVGTLNYMAPEQFFSPRDVDIRADIYSLGCTLYALLLGRPPFAEDHHSVVEHMQAHRDQSLASFRHLRPDVSTALEEVIFWMMAKNPAERFETPAELGESLAHFSMGHDLPKLLELAEERSLPLDTGTAADQLATTESMLAMDDFAQQDRS
jgi:serine/threonine protein kinase